MVVAVLGRKIVKLNFSDDSLLNTYVLPYLEGDKRL